MFHFLLVPLVYSYIHKLCPPFFLLLFNMWFAYQKKIGMSNKLSSKFGLVHDMVNVEIKIRDAT